MAKDPAVLLYIGDWLTATAGMDADARGWYLNLILHNYDKGSLPDDVESLALLAGVKFSEYERFKQVLEQVLKQKFKRNEETGNLENEKTVEILRSRESFKDKRSRSGSIGVVIKLAKTITGYTKKHIEALKSDLYSYTDEQIEEAKSEQMLKHLLKLYENENENENKDINEDRFKEIAKISFDEKKCEFGTEFKILWLELIKTKKWRKKSQSAINMCLKQLMKYDEPFAYSLVEKSIGGDYQGVVYDTTDSSYKKYLNAKNGNQQNTNAASKAESRNNMVNLAKSILSGHSSENVA